MPEITEVGIEGVRVVALDVHRDHRGMVAEDFRREWIPGVREMVQGVVSLSAAGVLRGLHFHRRQSDWWSFYLGSAVVGLYDLRRGSPTEGASATVSIDADRDFRSLYIPRGVAHGFHTLEPVVLHYLIDEYFTGEDEYGLAWNDPGLGIEWPSTDPVLSERDRWNPSLADVLAADPPRFRG